MLYFVFGRWNSDIHVPERAAGTTCCRSTPTGSSVLPLMDSVPTITKYSSHAQTPRRLVLRRTSSFDQLSLQCTGTAVIVGVCVAYAVIVGYNCTCEGCCKGPLRRLNWPLQGMGRIIPSPLCSADWQISLLLCYQVTSADARARHAGQSSWAL